MGRALAAFQVRNGTGWTPEEFRANGEAEWRSIAPLWERYGLDPESCVEIGCGAGRMTGALARRFKVVHAVDVSSGMLEHARRYVRAPSVTFHLTDGTELPLADASITAAFSTIVFQHFAAPRFARRYFEELARTLVDGGTMMIQLPVHVWPGTPRLFGALLGAKRLYQRGRAALKRRLAIPLMFTTSYEGWLARRNAS